MYLFKKAETEDEFEQIHRLNHAVFAGELGQHARRDAGLLVDKFHDKNQYIIAIDGSRVVGMIAFHDRPPFSAAEKLADPSVIETLGRISEIRLLAIDPGHRNGTLLRGLFLSVYDLARDCDAVVISGRAEEEKMYRALGFRPLGPPVASGGARFIPMALNLADLESRAARWRRAARFRLA